MRALTVSIGLVALHQLWKHHPREAGPERLGWRLVLAGCALWILGVGVQTLQTTQGEYYRSFNWGDIFFLPSGLMAFLGLARLPCKRVRDHERLATMLDLAIGGISAASLYWFLVLLPSVDETDLRTPARIAISLIYPIFEFLILMVLVNLLVRGAERPTSTGAYRWGAASFLLLLVSDVLLEAGPELWETPLGRLWIHGANMVFAALIGVAGSRLGSRPAKAEDTESPQIFQAVRESLVPITWVSIPGIALAWRLVTNGPDGTSILVGAILVLVPLLVYRLRLSQLRLETHLRTSIITSLLPVLVGSQLAGAIAVALVLAMNGLETARRVASADASMWAEKASLALEKGGRSAVAELERTGSRNGRRTAVLGPPGILPSEFASKVVNKIDPSLLTLPSGDVVWKPGTRTDYELLAWERLPGSEAIVVVSTPLPILLRPAQRAEAIILLLFALSSFASALLLMRRAKRLSAPLEDLTWAASRIQAGSLDLPRLRHGPDEVGRLGVALEEMVGRLTGHVGELRSLADRADEANKAKGRFLANMSHEIRTPLNGILGMAELLEGAELRGPEKRWLQAMRNSAESLRDLLGDILDFTKIEEGRMPVERVPTDPSRLLHELEALFQPIASRKGLEFRVHGEHDPDRDLLVDPVRVRQILTNLASNALKFTEKGFVRLGSRHADGTWIVEVEDSGTGIAPSSQDRIWDIFTQADESTTRRFGGTGLGLSISRQLARLMGGDLVLARSGPGEGSLFVLRLPAEPVERVSPPPDSRLQSPGKPLRILVAEDNAVNQKVAMGFLERLGCEGALVTDGWEAVEAARSGSWDLVLMDIHMPRLDGLEATRILRSEGYTGTIWALTASALAEEKAHCLEAGMDGFLAKPFSLAELRDALRTSQTARP